MIHHRGSESPPALFDLSNDIGETRDLASARPAILERLMSESNDWESALGRPQWGPGSPSRDR